MTPDETTRSEILQVLDRFQESYGRKNADDVTCLFAADSDVVVIGTGLDERRTGLEEIRMQLERDFSRADSLSVEFCNVSIARADSVALLAGDSIVRYTIGGADQSAQLRFTAALQKRKEEWLFVQAHFSVPFRGREPATDIVAEKST